MNRSVTILVLALVFINAESAFACTDPKCEKVLRVKDEETVVSEYFQPAKIRSEKKKDLRSVSEIADSILASAKMQFEAKNTIISETERRNPPMRVEAETTSEYARYKADSIVIKTKMWSDSICSLFRRGKYELEGELLAH